VVKAGLVLPQLSNDGGGAIRKRMLDPAQLRAARGLLKWSRQDLAKASSTGRETVQDFESRGSNPKRATLMAWERALKKAGVLFIDADEINGPGVRFRDKPTD
jgi:transcriptional regulator with XRE-family HTH domain